ncbi:MAG: hypothetical protein FJ271_13430 [Planctomycetes bacterium]|nr:hypothetical protein [Planctomycetota bacterium]
MRKMYWPMKRMAGAVIVAAGFSLLAAAADERFERFERFDTDPGWEGPNNRAKTPMPRTVKQDFGYSRTAHAGGQAGEIGGFITPAAEPAYYGKRIDVKSLSDPLTASGKLICKGRQFHVLLGFFNAGTVNEWRTPNSMAIRLLGRGDVFYAFVEYATSRWRAGGDSPGGFATVREPKSGKLRLRGFATGVPLTWSLRYDPTANKGSGAVTVTLGKETAVCHLDPGHRADGATFNRFGLLAVSKSAVAGGEIWLDDVTIDGRLDEFARDPSWEGRGNRRTYESSNVRPRFDFGFSPTRHAGGAAAGELGGLVFRGDCRFKDKIACYGDRLEPLTLEKPLQASGKVCLRRGVTDSTVLLGFYHSKDSMEVTASQASGIPRSFLGVAVEGPSREGFLFYPIYRSRGEEQGYSNSPDRPHILPDGKPHDWSLAYTPKGDGGTILVTLDRRSVAIDLPPKHRARGASFNRFGLVTTWIDGNGQQVFFDDLQYTFKQ